ncbi:hypothetical protein ERY430_41011 [Erythrobacter sp. EC-HK427]|nr:hypothetical protein ERY430_41011 [Erythrobacter sp. EC-HK427]
MYGGAAEALVNDHIGERKGEALGRIAPVNPRLRAGFRGKFTQINDSPHPLFDSPEIPRTRLDLSCRILTSRSRIINT